MAGIAPKSAVVGQVVAHEVRTVACRSSDKKRGSSSLAPVQRAAGLSFFWLLGRNGCGFP